MKKYQLFLDESGGFIENKNGKKVDKPSSVAGYLAENQDCTEEWAESIFCDVKNSDSRFSKININPFHGLQTYNNPNMTAFVFSAGGTFIKHPDIPVCRKIQPADQLNQCGLSCAVDADESNGFAFSDVQRNILDSGDAVWKCLCQVFEYDHLLHLFFILLKSMINAIPLG